MIVALLLLLLQLLQLLSMSEASTKPPTFTLDYSKPPSQRWNGALELATQGKSWEETWGAVFSHHNESLFNYLTPKMYTRMANALRENFPDRAEEIEGIEAQFAALFPNDEVVSFEYLAAWIYYHELAHSDLGPSSVDDEQSCTGLLASDSQGHVHHVANMDQSPPNIRHVTLHVKFVNGEDNMFQGVDWYWFTTGLTRMVKRGVMSIQENWRTDETLALEDVLKDVETGVTPQVFVFRNALEKAVHNSSIGFEDMVEQMATIPLASPYYIVMAGPEKMQGVVIARDNLGIAAPDGLLRLGEDDGNPTTATNPDPDLSSWAMAQTNYDHWKADREADPRRTVAEHTLANYGREEAASKLGLYAIASTYPVHSLTTAYTAVMDSKTGELHPFVRVSVCPVNDLKCQNRAVVSGFGLNSGGGSNNLQRRITARVSIHWSYTVMTVLSLVILVLIGLVVNLKVQHTKFGGSKFQYNPIP